MEELVSFNLEEAKSHPERIRTKAGEKIKKLAFNKGFSKFSISGVVEDTNFPNWWDSSGINFYSTKRDLRLIKEEVKDQESPKENTIDSIIEGIFDEWSKSRIPLCEFFRKVYIRGVNSAATATYKDGYNNGIRAKIEISDEHMSKLINRKLAEIIKSRTLSSAEAALWGMKELASMLNSKEFFL